MRLPLDPLLTQAPSLRVLARLIRVHDRQLYRWKDYGLTIDQADKAAAALSLHPAELWPEWWNLDPTCEECGKAIEPRCSNHRYCSRSCSNRAYKRDRRAA